jgi:hypothetical protein
MRVRKQIGLRKSRDRILVILEQFPGGTEETHDNLLSQVRRYSGQDSKRAPPE